MTLLSICQDAADWIPVQRPTTVAGNSNRTARLLLACAKEGVQDLARRHNWANMVREHTFTTVSGTDSYALPSDYRSMVSETAWDRDNYWELRGDLSAADWQRYQSSILGQAATVRDRFRIRAYPLSTTTGAVETQRFYIDPTPTTAKDLVFDYLSDSPIYINGSSKTRQTNWEADNDLTFLDEYILTLGVKWRMMERLGMPYAEAREAYEREIGQAIARDGGGARVLHMDSPFGYRFLGWANIPDTGYGS